MSCVQRHYLIIFANWLYVCGVNVLLTCVYVVRCVVDGQLVSVVVVSLKVYMLLSGVLQCGIEL